FRYQDARLTFKRFRAHLIKVAEIRGNGFDPEGAKDIKKQVRRRAVEILRSEHCRARRQFTGKQSGMEGRHPGRICASSCATFDGANRVFQCCNSWISVTRVNEIG